MRPVPVLMYHHVNHHKGDMVTVTPEAFEGQMRYLSEAEYRILSLDDLVDYAMGEMPIAERAVAITFDDGYLDNYIFIYPILKRYNIKASIFIVTDWVDEASECLWEDDGNIPYHKEGKELIAEGQANKVIMNWDILREMVESGLVGIYSHTMSHRRCADLNEQELVRELKSSKLIIEDMLKRPCPYLSWPKGAYNKNSVRVAADVGYRALFTTMRGVARAGYDKNAIERVVVKDSIDWFKKRIRIYTNKLSSKLYLTLRGRD